MKCHQDHIIRILDCKNIPYEMVDIADPHRKDEKLFMQGTLKLKDEDLVALPPQIFNEKTYRGVSTVTITSDFTKKGLNLRKIRDYNNECVDTSS